MEAQAFLLENWNNPSSLAKAEVFDGERERTKKWEWRTLREQCHRNLLCEFMAGILLEMLEQDCSQQGAELCPSRMGALVPGWNPEVNPRDPWRG